MTDQRTIDEILVDDNDLTRREVEVLGHIARGLSNREIAEELFVSINSVKTYIRLAYRKIRVTRRSHAILWSLDRGLGRLTTSP